MVIWGVTRATKFKETISKKFSVLTPANKGGITGRRRLPIDWSAWRSDTRDRDLVYVFFALANARQNFGWVCASSRVIAWSGPSRTSWRFMSSDPNVSVELWAFIYLCNKNALICRISKPSNMTKELSSCYARKLVYKPFLLGFVTHVYKRPHWECTKHLIFVIFSLWFKDKFEDACQTDGSLMVDRKKSLGARKAATQLTNRLKTRHQQHRRLQNVKKN